MSSNFPPSSPVTGGYSASYSQFEHETKSIESPESSFNFAKADAKFGRNGPQTKTGKYPTPFPSSSTGRSSSPVKARSHSVHDSNSDEDMDSSFVMPTSDVEQRPSLSVRSQSTHKKYKIFSRIINIEIDPLSTSKLAIGRKRDLCDILLPAMKTISRIHAFISYIPDRNQVRLECIGVNSIIVTLPRNLNCFLIKPVPETPVYELTGSETIKMLQQFKTVDINVKKELVKDQNLTAFVLEKGETVLMPFMNNTILDFKQVKAKLSLKQEVSRPELPIESESSKSAEQQKIKSGVASHKLKRQPLANNIITPNSSFIIREPKTPSKKIRSDLTEEKNTILSSNLNGALKSATEPIPHKLTNSTNQNNSSAHKRKLGTSGITHHGPKEHKIAKIEPQRSQEEIMKSLEDMKVDISGLQNVLANHLAFANILQTPLSQLKDASSQVKTLTKEELRAILADGSCIGVINRQGKDAAGKPLEEEYFYDMENDDNVERKSMVTAMKGGRSGLRSCRRTHKQYFWKKPSK